MPVQSPKIDNRSYEDVIRQVQDWAETYTAVVVSRTRDNLSGRILYEDIDPAAIPPLVKGTLLEGEALEALLIYPGVATVQVKRWQADPGNMDAGRALIQIFARMAAVVIDRLNRVPDKNFLAFLDLVGAQLNPPQPARVPLSFQLAEGSPVDARVPAGTQVAAPPDEAIPEEVTFETDAELTIVRAQLVNVFVRDPDHDTYSNFSDIATGERTSQFTPFTGIKPIEHSLYIPVADESFKIIRNRNLSLKIASSSPQQLSQVPLVWSYWDGKLWKGCSPVVTFDSSAVNYDFNGLAAAIELSEIQGRKARWLRAQLDMRLQRGMVTVTHALTASDVTNVRSVDLGGAFYPFGQTATRTRYLYLRVNVYDAAAPAVDLIRLSIQAASAQSYPPGLVLLWEFRSGTGWEELGRSQAPEIPAAPNFDDSTGAFTRSSMVSFKPPANWQSRTLYNQPEGYWLRVSIASGDYATLPVISFPIAYPHFGTITVIWQGGGSDDLIPQKALFNQSEIDLTKDFYPFGETPKFNDTFYLAHNEAFAAPGFRVMLDVSLTKITRGAEQVDISVTPSKDLKLAWEYWDSKMKRWQPLTIIDNKKEPKSSVLAQSGKVEFDLPSDVGPTEVNGELNHWIRVRIVAGTYGTKERYVQQEVKMGETTVTVNVFVPAAYTPPSIQSLDITYRGTQTESRAVDPYLLYNDFTFSRSDETSVDFFPIEDPQPTLYLGFDKPFPNRACQLYFEVKSEEASPTLLQPTEPPRLTWEYLALGKIWKPLGVRDETRAFTRRGLVSFLGPADAIESVDFHKSAYWLRTRWDGGAYAMPPQLTRILTNTTWATQAITQQAEFLGSSNGEKNQVFRTARTPVLNDQSLEIRELDMLTDNERERIETEEGADAVQITYDASGLPENIWVRWHEVPDFYASSTDDRHYVLDRQTGEIRFGDGLHGKIPPQGRANIRATYRSGGGASGNRPARVVAELKTAVPYIDSVMNYTAAEGGADAETLNKLLQRGPRIIRHRNRAVVPQDFEDLAFLASPQIARARAIAASNASTAGQVKVIIVPEGRQARPAPTVELVTRVTDYLTARCDPTLVLQVSGPAWIEINIEADIVPVSLEATNTVIAAVDNAVSAFLHPLTGSVDHQGWPFGRQPQQSDLFRVIESVEGVDHVHRLLIQADTSGDVPPESSLIYSGAHKISLVSLESLGE